MPASPVAVLAIDYVSKGVFLPEVEPRADEYESKDKNSTGDNQPGADFVNVMKALKEAEINMDTREAYAGTNKAAATQVRKVFLQAKKVSHEARQEIQAIKKGDKSSVEDFPVL